MHDSYASNHIREVVGAIESESTHPLAKAIRNYSLRSLHKETFSIKVDDMKTLSGRGIMGMVNDEAWHIGKENLTTAKEHTISKQAAQFADEGKTVVYVALLDQIVAIYALKDTVRQDAKVAIAALRKQQIYTIMLTGDNKRTAKAVAEELGIEDVVAECLPEEKVDHVNVLLQKYGKTAMIGDGINDER